MSGPGERPRRWTFTWLLRIQRGGKDPLDTLRGAPPPPPQNGETKEQRIRHWAAIILGFAVAIELAVGVWLDILPR